MSLTQIPQPITRINRSELAVPASNPCFIDTASRSDADVVFIHLEDADGKMIDLDSQRQAEIVVRKADAISERTP